jgi:hypothetical protein
MYCGCLAVQPAIAAGRCSPNCDVLRRNVVQQGVVTIIVMFDIPNLPNHTRASDKDWPVVVQARENAIRQAQDRAIARLASYKIRVNRRLTLTPGMGLTVNAAALEDLIANLEIEGIEEDHPAAPSRP